MGLLAQAADQEGLALALVVEPQLMQQEDYEEGVERLYAWFRGFGFVPQQDELVRAPGARA
jgi:hypothetical protein